MHAASTFPPAMSLESRVELLAAVLSALAGFVDATGFLMVRGFFVSFMSGNTTRFVVSTAQGLWPAALAGGLIIAFVFGAILGAVVRHFSPRAPAKAVLFAVAGILLAAAAAGTVGFVVLAMLIMAVAMGAENAVFERHGEVTIAITYVTGILVKLGQHIAEAFLGGPRWGWPRYLILWLSLAAGAAAASLVWYRLGSANLWLAAFAAALCAVFSRPADEVLR